MSKEYIGALIVFAPPSGALNYDSTGTELDSAVKQKLLVSIFRKEFLYTTALLLFGITD